MSDTKFNDIKKDYLILFPYTTSNDYMYTNTDHYFDYIEVDECDIKSTISNFISSGRTSFKIVKNIKFDVEIDVKIDMEDTY